MTGCINIKPKERRRCNIEKYKCPVCGNTDIHSIGILNGKPYCRRCISFKGEEVEHKPSYPKKAPIYLEYELSPEQKELSDKLVENYKKGIDSLVFAVCGSGKTEIVVNAISYAIKNGDKVGFAIPRRDVVIELFYRLKQIFKGNKVISVYGGHTSKLDGDLICLTTHQLFRYEKYFNLLIIDEIDAFPFKDNPVLEAFYKRSNKGVTIMLSATPSKKTIEKFSKNKDGFLRLNKRFHGKPLPVPYYKKRRSILIYYDLIKECKKFQSRSKQIMIFTPTISICERVYKFISLFVKHGNFVHSKRDGRAEIIGDFKNKKYQYLVTTAVLERGVTIKDLQVIIFRADHPIYDSASLVQISGRVGRKKDAPTGEIVYLCREITPSIIESIEEIKKCNEVL